MIMRVGDEIAGRFALEEEVVDGPVARLFRARDRRTGARVAIKLLRADVEGDVQRFQRECDALAALRHPGVARYVAHGATPAGEPFLAREWLDGEDLASALARGPLLVEDVLALGQAAAAALGAMHARGVVHRDVKPANLFLPDGEIARVKLLDLGLARRARVNRSTTRNGSLLGTPGYMAPEQVRGQRDIDPRADVFALGVVLYECLAGARPIKGDSVEAVLGNTLLDDAPHVRDARPDVAPELDALLASMLSRDPALRPPNGDAVVSALATIASAGGPTAPDSLSSAASVAASVVSGEGTDVRTRLPPPDASAFDELPTTPPVERPSAPAITTGERRLLSAVMLCADDGDKAFDANLGVLRRAAEASGAEFEVLMDGVALAILRADGAATDQAARAARCALAMRHFAPSVPMAMATGWGEVAGRGAVGEVIDRAAKLLRDARELPRGEAARRDVALGEIAAGLLDARFDVRAEGGVLALRGERTPDGTRTLLGRETPFVGRRRELATLMASLEECIEEPVARAVLITAAAGVGKTRLVMEFARAARARFPTLEVFTSRADALRAGAPYALIAPILRGMFEFAPNDPLGVRREKVVARVSRRVPEGERTRVSEFIGELIGTPFVDDDSVQLRAARQDPVLLGDQTARAWEDLLAAECADHPMLLVLEDLQWGDPPSVRLIDAALRTLTHAPLLVVAHGRPETAERLPDLWVEHAPQEIKLGPLTRKASEEVVAAVLPSLEPPVVERILERAAGNPFYLEELLRAASQGRGLALPGTVLAMLQARLEALEPEVRRALRAASVFGPTFWAAGVCTLLGVEPNDPKVNAAIEGMIARELVVPRPEARFASQRELAFASTQLRDAAYAMLTQADATLGHRLAAPWLESVGERDPVILADHYERGGQLLRAVPWYLVAAEEALGGNDFGGALARVERGVACGATGAQLGRLQVIAAEARRWRGEHREALRAGEAAMDALPPGDPLWFNAAAEAAIAAARVSDTARLRRLVRRLDAAPCGDEASGAQAEARARASVQCLAVGEAELARALVDQLPGEREEGDPRVEARVLNARAMLADFDGDVAAHGRLLDAAARRYEEAGDLRNMCLLRVGVGSARMAVGRYDKAEGALREARAAALRLGLTQVVALAESGLARALAMTGRLDDAWDMGQRALRSFVQQGDVRMAAQTWATLARVELLAGRLGAARDAALEAVQGAGAVAPLRALALATLSAVRTARGEAAEAVSAGREAVAALQTLDGVTEDEGFILLVHAESLALADRWDDARRAITAAWDRLQQRAARFEDEAARARFLGAIPEHARTESLFHAWAADA